jgi:hypothetical protein
VLATLTVEDDSALVAETSEAVATANGMATTAKTYREADVADYVSLIVVVTCGCGAQFQVDVAAFMRRDPVALPTRMPCAPVGPAVVASSISRPTGTASAAPRP